MFGIPLKIVACQDPGNRHRELWDAFALEDHEDHEIICQVIEQALGEKPGTQLITDQGTPYLAHEAQRCYEEMELDHAPQKEGAATDKATLERSFRTVKEAVQPLTSGLLIYRYLSLRAQLPQGDANREAALRTLGEAFEVETA